MIEKLVKSGVASKLASVVAFACLAFVAAVPVSAAETAKPVEKIDMRNPPFPVSPEDKQGRIELLSKVGFKDAETCIGCHDEQYQYPVFSVFKTKHGVMADARTPMANQQCESCHGPGGVHVKAKKEGKRHGTIVSYRKGTWVPIKDQNDKCLACHQTNQRIAWKGSTHDFNGIGCASCHTIHAAKDPVLDREQQARVCFTCHNNKQAKFVQASHHPVREGQMACSECHNVHGEDGTGLMVKATSREKCVSCHADKRGPYLWEHAPAAEDCTLCHDPHGSNQPALLKKRVPQLCQECHDPAGHPGGSYGGTSLAAGSFYLQAKGCTNCHSAIHGSNHPAGMTLLR